MNIWPEKIVNTAQTTKFTYKGRRLLYWSSAGREAAQFINELTTTDELGKTWHHRATGWKVCCNDSCVIDDILHSALKSYKKDFCMQFDEYIEKLGLS